MAGSFYRISCPDCGNEQPVFGKVSSTVSCAVCGHTIAEPTGGKSAFHGEIVAVVEHRTEHSDGIRGR